MELVLLDSDDEVNVLYLSNDDTEEESEEEDQQQDNQSLSEEQQRVAAAAQAEEERKALQRRLEERRRRRELLYDAKDVLQDMKVNIHPNTYLSVSSLRRRYRSLYPSLSANGR